MWKDGEICPWCKKNIRGSKNPPVFLALKFSVLKDKIPTDTQPNIEPLQAVYTKKKHWSFTSINGAKSFV